MPRQDRADDRILVHEMTSSAIMRCCHENAPIRVSNLVSNLGRTGYMGWRVIIDRLLALLCHEAVSGTTRSACRRVHVWLWGAIHTVGPRLRHFHSCENDRGAPGQGHVPWSDVATALCDVNYDGPVVIESFSAQIERTARAAAIWRPLAPGQDALAQEGLALLRQLLA